VRLLAFLLANSMGILGKIRATLTTTSSLIFDLSVQTYEIWSTGCCRSWFGLAAMTHPSGAGRTYVQRLGMLKNLLAVI